MPRPKRKEIKFTNKSTLALMQEIYNENMKRHIHLKLKQVDLL